MSDGSELAELHALNEFDIQQLRTKLNLAQGNSVDISRQLAAAFRLITKCRDLLGIIWDKELQNTIHELITEIDEFYPTP